MLFLLQYLTFLCSCYHSLLVNVQFIFDCFGKIIKIHRLFFVCFVFLDIFFKIISLFYIFLRLSWAIHTFSCFIKVVEFRNNLFKNVKGNHILKKRSNWLLLILFLSIAFLRWKDLTDFLCYKIWEKIYLLTPFFESSTTIGLSIPLSLLLQRCTLSSKPLRFSDVFSP